MLSSAEHPVAESLPLFIVVNAGSGNVESQDRIAIIRKILAEAGRRHELIPVAEPRQLGASADRAIELARRHGGAVVAAGGDGTINAIVQQVLPTELPFGILPQGTFNYTGRAHGIPTDIEEGTRALLTAQLKPIQVGLVNDRVFLVNASVGLYPDLLEDREAFKQRFGRTRLVALFSGLATLLRGHRRLSIRLERDGRQDIVRTSTLFVGNNPLQLEQVGIAEGTALDAGKLVGIMVKPVGKLAMLGLLVRGAIGSLGDAENVSSMAFSELVVQVGFPYGARRIKVATDGEINWLRSPLVFRPAPQLLQLLVPADTVAPPP
ncbi:MAG: diacylglycerol kinase [Burkholderiales bacterium]|nr:diacylglycerol kinase [Burkholderiales bacterium]